MYVHVQINQSRQKYTVVVIVIDGDGFDNQSTVDAIVEAGDKAVSLIIIGVGNCAFINCRRFDADDVALRHSDGRVMKRDIVQFVPFECHKSDMIKLAEVVLAELPGQIVQFMESKGIVPNVIPNIPTSHTSPIV